MPAHGQDLPATVWYNIDRAYTYDAGVLGTYAYDDLGRRTSLTRGNGLVTGYGYDAVSRLNSLSHDLSGTSNDVTFSYSHDPSGGMASLTRSNDAYAYTGHANGSTSYAADGLSRLAAIGGAGLGYDTRGNANDIPPAATLRNEETFFGYIATNALATVSSSTLYRELIADSAERLHRYYDGSANRWFLYDGAEAIAETSASASAIVRSRCSVAPAATFVAGVARACSPVAFPILSTRGEHILAASAHHVGGHKGACVKRPAISRPVMPRSSARCFRCVTLSRRALRAPRLPARFSPPRRPARSSAATRPSASAAARRCS